MPSELEYTLADMRRKYLEALAHEKAKTKSWLEGKPISSAILAKWIPVVEKAVIREGKANSQKRG